MIFGNFIIDGFKNNECFKLDSRDDCCLPFIELRNKLKKHDIEINTSDLNTNNVVSFEIHIDNQVKSSFKVPILLLLYETSYVNPLNASVDGNKYKKVYTWDDDLVISKNFNKFFLPVASKNIINVPGFEDRSGFCCAMSGNKATNKKHDKDLYSERVKIFTWFEKNAPHDFDLYGPGWDRPIAKNGFINKKLSKLTNMFNLKAYNFKKTYKGFAKSKSNVLQQYKYSVCYENVFGLNGYITEKIFDSMLSGTVPIYWGADNISSYIPEECFIDRRNFFDDKSLYKFLKSIDKDTFMCYQKAINSFLESDKFKKFSIEYYVDEISNEIIKELGINEN